MQRIPLELATEAMQSAKQVCHAGKVLVSPGDPLTEPVKTRLRSAHITDIIVQGSPLRGATMEYDVARVQERLPYLFRNCHTDPVMERVFITLSHLLSERSSK